MPALSLTKPATALLLPRSARLPPPPRDPCSAIVYHQAVFGLNRKVAPTRKGSEMATELLQAASFSAAALVLPVYDGGEAQRN